MNNKIEPIETLIDAGLVRAFRKTFDVELTLTNVSNKLEVAQKRSQGQTIKYPLAFAELNSLALPDQPHYRAQTMLRRGIVGSATSDNLGTFKVPAIPVNSTYQITYLTNSFAQARKFSKLWLMSAAAGFLSFEVLYGVASFGIRLELDRQVSLPQRDSSPDAVDEYEVTANLIVQGYVSHDALIDEQAAIATVSTATLTQDLEASLKQPNASDTEVFYFKREWPVGDGPLTR